jgi:hypothetical protein
VASLRERLEALEAARRARVADELRKLLRTISDEEIARWVLGFRRGEAEEEYVPEALADSYDLFDEAMGNCTNLSKAEADRWAQFIVSELLEFRRSGIRAWIRKLEKLEMEGEDE